MFSFQEFFDSMITLVKVPFLNRLTSSIFLFVSNGLLFRSKERSDRDYSNRRVLVVFFGLLVNVLYCDKIY